ncbi:MAG: DUF5686 and carboxypeptidase regulatory-like domain-containing protein [Bacteriodetes bacterium]|nr:DUF5686 and carboxypeptidase regulatory-like domain-containing protein [Bacteroidota bacterium]
MRVLLLFILAIITVTGVEAQVVRGIVRDSVSNEPMRSVTVKVDGTKKGVITNKNGEFTLRLAKGNYTFVFSFIGYKTERRNVSVVDSVNLKILLKEAPSSAAEVVVYGEDPAVRLMRKVIERKKRQQDSLQTYSYMLYTKFDASTDTVTAGRTSGRGDTTIVSIFESYSKGYYSKPDKYFNEIVQRRQTANIPPEANVVTFGTNTNGYDDYITFFNEQVATPFHPDAIDYYDFTILKTLQEDDTVTITRITVTPKGNGRKLFAGYIDIDEKNLIPIACKLKPNRAVQLPFDAALEYEQSFQRVGDMIVPQYMRIQGNVQIHLFWVINPRLDLNIETMAYDYTINQQLENELFEQRRTEVSKVAEKFDSTFWQERSVMQLRPEEASAYKQIEQSLENNDSTVASGLFDQIFGWIPRTLSKLNRRPFTGIEDMLRYNRITGLYLGVGLLDTVAERWEATGKVGYGFSDKRWYGELGSKYYLDTNRKYSISAIAYQRLARRDNPYIVAPLTVTLFSALNKSDYGDYYYNNGGELSFEATFGQLRFIRRDIFARPSYIKVFTRREFHETATVNTQWSLFGSGRTYRENPPAQHGVMQSVGFDAGYYFSPYRRISNFGFGIQAEYASPAIGSDDFDFTLLSGQFVWRTTTLPLWRLDMRVNGGIVFGNAPPQRFYSLESSVSGLAADAVYRGMGIKEFYGDRFVAVSVEHSFGEVIPGVLRIPNLASFGIDFIAIGRVAWTKFTDKTRSLTNTPLPSTAATLDELYYECGLGINKLLIFFRFDISARLSQRTKPQFFFTLSAATF